MITTPLRNPSRRAGADTDDIEPVFGEIADDGADLGRADVEADNQVFSLAGHALLPFFLCFSFDRLHIFVDLDDDPVGHIQIDASESAVRRSLSSG